jgi:hypothetical protein
MTWSRGEKALLALCAVYLLFGAGMSALAPCGSWDNVALGARLWNEGDPGGYYIPSAHELYSSRGVLLYPGHPGLTLQILLHAIQAGYHALAAPPGAGFSAFVASRLATVFLLSKIAMTAAHLASFWLFLAFARRLLRDERAALLATFGYATCLPVAYYLSRVSVEPLMIVCFLATFLALWRSEDAASPAWAAAAGAAAASGLATKLHLLWPLPLIGLAMLRRRPKAALAFAAAAAAALAAYSSLLDWRDFFAYWEVPAVAAGGPLRRTLAGLLAMPLANWLPGPTRSGLFLLCEGPLLTVAAYGLWLIVRRREESLARLAWPAAAAGCATAVWAYRSAAVSGDFHGFHYLFPFMLIAAALFGRGSRELLSRAPSAGLGLWIVAIHAVTLRATLDTRVKDAVFYRKVRPYQAGRPELSGLGILRTSPPERARSALIEAARAARPEEP